MKNLLGGKGANLGEMYNLGIPVPNGYCVTAEAYFKFIEANKLKPKIKAILDTMDVDDPEQGGYSHRSAETHFCW